MIDVRRAVTGHFRTAIAIVVGLATYAVCIPFFENPSRTIIAWDAFAIVLLGFFIELAWSATPDQMPANAKSQQEAEWTIFFIVVLGTIMSFVAIIGEFSGTKDLSPATRHEHVTLVVVTLVLSWLVTQIVFGFRYAHEYYTATKPGTIDKGLDFPGEEEPDYWDFAYFAIVLGMTFQVSDVQISSRKLRRLATLHGLLGFTFNTVILALTVNLAANLL